jgi:hypothetical protein
VVTVYYIKTLNVITDVETKCELMEGWKVLIVGNNPMELSRVNDQLKGIRETRVLTEMAFDTQSIFRRLVKFGPQHLIMDDNIGKITMQGVVARMQKRNARPVPITVLKNSNYQETICSGVTNYVLKENLTSELLYRELLNSTHFQKSQAYWNRAYGKREGQLSRLLKVATIQI